MPATPSSPPSRILALNTSAPASSEQTMAPPAPPKPPLQLVVAPDPTSTPGPTVGLEPAPALPARSLRSGSREGKPCSITQVLGLGEICVGGFICDYFPDRISRLSPHCQECKAAGCPESCSRNCNGADTPRLTFPNTCPRQAPRCSFIGGTYTRSFDKAVFTVSQTGCTAHFTRLTGTAGSSAYSVTVAGTHVARHQSAPGYVQANGDIKFLSGVVYARGATNGRGRGI